MKRMKRLYSTDQKRPKRPIYDQERSINRKIITHYYRQYMELYLKNNSNDGKRNKHYLVYTFYL
jgi:hypothetical protein